GGKQYRVSPGDVIRIERQAPTDKDGSIEFTDVLAVSHEQGKVARPEGERATVSGRVVEEGRADKILVFHYKRKKQYKRLRGHRQRCTGGGIPETTSEGQRSTAPAEEERKPKAKPAKAKAAAEEAEPHAKEAKPAGKKAAKSKAAATKSAKASPKKKK